MLPVYLIFCIQLMSLFLLTERVTSIRLSMGAFNKTRTGQVLKLKAKQSVIYELQMPSSNLPGSANTALLTGSEPSASPLTGHNVLL